MKKKNIILFFLVLFFLLNFSCIFDKKVKFNKIFKLGIGVNEDQIGFLSDNDTVSFDNVNFYYVNGFYYISDFVNKKILKITESGLINLMIYNGEFNYAIKDDKAKDSTKDSTIDTTGEVFLKSYVEYSELYPRKIAADLDGNIYVENVNPSYKKYSDTGTILNSLIVKFDKNGKVIYQLGREGINSTPFTSLNGIVVDNKNNLLAAERIGSEYIFYKFNPDGKLLGNSVISRLTIPLTEKEENYLVDITAFAIGYKNDEIFLSCQYINEDTGKFKLKSYETVYEKVLVYSMAKNRILKMAVKIEPDYLDLSGIKSNDALRTYYGEANRIMKPMEYFIGVDSADLLYFMKKELSLNYIYENKNRVTVYSKDGSQKNNFLFELPERVDFISNFFVSPEGKIAFFYIQQGEIQFAEF